MKHYLLNFFLSLLQRISNFFDRPVFRSESPRILIMAHDNKIGDAIIHSGLLPGLKKILPGVHIGILCGKANKLIFESGENALYVSPHRGILARARTILQARKQNYDYLLYFGLDADKTSFRIISNLVNVRHRILFHQPIYSLPTDIIIKGDWSNLHYSERHKKALSWFGKTDVDEYRYTILGIPDIPIPDSKTYIVLNRQGSTADKSLSDAWLKSFVSLFKRWYPEENFTLELLSSSPHDQKHLEHLLPDISIPKYKSLKENLALIKRADYVITTDTYASHAASTWQKPVLVFCTLFNNVVFAPRNTKFVLCVPPVGQTLNNITPEAAVNAFSQLLPFPP